MVKTATACGNLVTWRRAMSFANEILACPGDGILVGTSWVSGSSR
jgi:hypothetical protein